MPRSMSRVIYRSPRRSCRSGSLLSKSLSATPFFSCSVGRLAADGHDVAARFLGSIQSDMVRKRCPRLWR